MKSDEIREQFLSFFESKGCLRHPSASLVPDDPTLLTTSAGMVPFKPYFLGHKKPPHTRMTTSQKCLRAVDIDEVGRTPRHHTFFEMLGNFSFGDYFKEDVIQWAWELLTTIYKIPIDRLRVTVFENDDEAAKIWLETVGVKPDMLYRLGEDDNYWPAGAPSKGPNGPCGPCSEIFYDFGIERGCGNPGCDVTCNCGRFIEIWNLVFMQFERQDGGALIPLPNKNIDTGSGLERVASVLQGTPTNFETDLLLPIIQTCESATGFAYADNTMPFRVIADHMRSVTFLIADGVFPSNEGRGYLLRKILRRAATYSHEIGVEKPFLFELAPVVADILGHQYPELNEKMSLITNVIKKEEEQFAEALIMGRSFVVAKESELGDKGALADGSLIFTAYDTYGLPFEEAEKIVAELGYTGIDRDAFDKAMEDQKERSRKGSKMDGSVFIEDTEKIYRDAAEAASAGTFDGYGSMAFTANVAGLFLDGSAVDTVADGHDFELLLDRTPFYGEMGGQTGDSGSGTFVGGSFTVADTFVVEGKIIIHKCKAVSGTIKKGDPVEVSVDPERRLAIMRHHTATHLLHAALRVVLGEHAHQAGSYVGPDKLRFDFSHHNAISPAQLAAIEKHVNDAVLRAMPVVTDVKSFEDARKEGAMALFGEKYGDTVRMVKIDDVSLELCGGTHVANTGQIGLVKIISERTIGSNMRRIEAVAGKIAVAYYEEKAAMLDELAILLNTQDTLVVKSVEALITEREKAARELRQSAQGKAKDSGQRLLAAAESNMVNGTAVIAEAFENMTTDALLAVFDEVKSKLPSYAVVLGSNNDGKAAIILTFSQDLVEKGLDAGAIIRDIARIAGGGGGGQKHLAQAGGKLGAAVPDAIAKGAELLKSKLG